MLSSSSSNCLSLTQELYQRVWDSIYQSCPISLQDYLDRCNFGIAPDAQGVQTLFIIAPNQGIAQDLLQHLDSLLEKVSEQMIGINQTAICFAPIADDRHPSLASHDLDYDLKLSPFLVGKIFCHPC